MAAFILRYGSFQQRPREAEAESQAYMEERLRRTRSNLPALRVRLALMDRDFDELGMGLSQTFSCTRLII